MRFTFVIMEVIILDRLTGLHETSSMYKFSYSVGGRNTSIRIPFY